MTSMTDEVEDEGETSFSSQGKGSGKKKPGGNHIKLFTAVIYGFFVIS